MLLRGFVSLLAALPRRFVGTLSRCLHWLIRPLLKKELKKLYLNSEKILGLASHSVFAQNFAKQVIQHQLESGIESLVSAHLAQNDPINISGFSELQKTVQGLKEKGKGIIVVTGHMGSWEFVAKYCSKAADEPFYALAKPSKAPAVTAYMDESRGKMNTKVLWTDKKSILKDMISVLKKGKTLGFVMDQKPEGRQGPEVNFFDQPTKFVAGPAKLAIRMKAPILAVFCMREGPWQYRIIHKVIAEPDHQHQDETGLTQEMAAAIEEVIRLYPEQWVWNYKRWRFP